MTTLFIETWSLTTLWWRKGNQKSETMVLVELSTKIIWLNFTQENVVLFMGVLRYYWAKNIAISVIFGVWESFSTNFFMALPHSQEPTHLLNSARWFALKLKILAFKYLTQRYSSAKMRRNFCRACCAIMKKIDLILMKFCKSCEKF